MPLILAIEPDRRQASQLNAVVKGRLHADLVLADSAERALAELGERVPDLILTSALLSPTDEVVLGERLRALNGVAAHVQTLTIPVLAAPRPTARRGSGGMLAALRRNKPQEEPPDGCDPSVFAAQCAEYLERAAADQAMAAAAAERGAVGHEEPAPASEVDDPWDTSTPPDTAKEFDAGHAEFQHFAASIEPPREPIAATSGSIVAEHDPIEASHARIETWREPTHTRREPTDAPREPVTMAPAAPATHRMGGIPLSIDAP